ncbi:hypothetical protein CA54_01280 [Symmachiella macrocystis]|uniref:Uncharacterized protein n=1 Tax=Symmachiella macrocystis TaxID=2527985 RepID=A0A5C6BHX7_9PLAN|nr:hypothetical protein CA54_01280 [Symmachiella macrocystis]
MNFVDAGEMTLHFSGNRTLRSEIMSLIDNHCQATKKPELFGNLYERLAVVCRSTEGATPPRLNFCTSLLRVRTSPLRGKRKQLAMESNVKMATNLEYSQYRFGEEIKV